MSSNTIIIILVAVLVLGGGYVLWQNTDLFFASQVQEEIEDSSDEASGGTELAYMITYTDSGFSPSELTVPAGEAVTFANSSSREFWPASAQHPTHTVYPGSDIQKCGTEESEAIFDACSPVATGNIYAFVFREAGEWFYHDHLNPSEFGKIIVQ